MGANDYSPLPSDIVVVELTLAPIVVACELQLGLLGDVKPVGDGVFEMREDFGSGWRMYYIKRGDIVILMLGGGDKSTQAKDIKAAKDLAETLED